MNCTDFLRLSQLKMLEEVRENLPKNITNASNLIAVRDGVLFTWDFQNNCVLTSNIKAARAEHGHKPQYQKLLPLRLPLFTPEFLLCNESGTLLAVWGRCGVLVLELPARCPPHGLFDSNKEVVYCRSHSLDERLFSCSETHEVRQVKFHPGSIKDRHLVVLTSANDLRIYEIQDQDSVKLSTHCIGEKPKGLFPGTKTPFLECFGEVAVDFDFGLPELSKNNTISTSTSDLHPSIEPQLIPKKDSKEKWNELSWPVYVLRGDGSLFYMDLNLSIKKGILKGPIPLRNKVESDCDACALVCLNCNPPVLCVAFTDGTLGHSVVLDLSQEDFDELKGRSKTVFGVSGKEILFFEDVELELGLTTSEDDENHYKCPIFLHKDESKPGRYFATHNAGVHSVDVGCMEELQNFILGSKDEDPDEDIFEKRSNVEYLVCTKTSSSEKCNPVVGFALYYEPTSIIALLSNKNLISLGVLPAAILPKFEDLSLTEVEEINSPLKRMLKEPFDQYIQKILSRVAAQPILKVSCEEENVERCYELLQRAAQVFREDYFKQHAKAREELEKRVRALGMLKKDQQREIERLNLEKKSLKETAESLAEKYEDIKEKQDCILSRCEKLLMLVAQRRAEPTDAERGFLKDINSANEKLLGYQRLIDKVKAKLKYQQMQIANYKAQEVKKSASINENSMNTIKSSLNETTKKITEMVKEVNKYSEQLGLK